MLEQLSENIRKKIIGL